MGPPATSSPLSAFRNLASARQIAKLLADGDCGLPHASIRHSRMLGTILATCWTSRGAPKPPSNACAQRCGPDCADAMFNLALLLQRTNQYAEAIDYWRRYLASDCQSEWAARARRSLKFCEMQINLIASA